MCLSIFKNLIWSTFITNSQKLELDAPCCDLVASLFPQKVAPSARFDRSIVLQIWPFSLCHFKKSRYTLRLPSLSSLTFRSALQCVCAYNTSFVWQWWQAADSIWESKRGERDEGLRQGNKSCLVRSRYKMCELHVKVYATRSQQGATSTSFCEKRKKRRKWGDFTSCSFRHFFIALLILMTQ